jgi:hypothetical protein
MAKSLTLAPGGQAPPFLLDFFSQQLRGSAQRGLYLTQELLRLVRLCQAAGIPVVPLKGPLLGQLAYGDIALRPFDDLDLLIQPHDFPRARQLLLAQGYQAQSPLTPAQLGGYVRKYHDYKLMRPDGRVRLELQWGITERAFHAPLNFDHLWPRLQPAKLAGQVVAQLGLADLLLVLCIHGAKHLWQRLIWVCDIAELLRQRLDLDWDELVRRAMQVGVRRMFYLGVRLAHDLLDAPLPPEVVKLTAREPGITSLLREIATWQAAEQQNAAALLLRRRHIYARMMERTRDRVRLQFHYYPRRFYAWWSTLGKPGEASRTTGWSCDDW